MYNNNTLRMTASNKGLKRIVIINVILFLIANIAVSSSVASGGSGSAFLDNTALDSNLWTVFYKPWTLITSMFLHIDFFHILFNMLYLWWFGRMLQASHSGQSVISAYVLGGLFGGVAYLLIYGLFMSNGISSILLGASGGVMSIMVAVAVLNPNKHVNLIFIGAVKIKWIVLTLFVLTTVLDIHQNTGGKIAHIGGAAYGFLYAFFLKKGLNIGAWFDKVIYSLSYFLKINSYGKPKTSQPTESTGFRGAQDRRGERSKSIAVKNKINRAESKQEMDILLAKISKIGYNKLSQKDKDRLVELSKDW